MSGRVHDDGPDPRPGRPVLRLVGDDAAEAALAAAEAVRRENLAAAVAPDLDPADPRWVLAVRTQSQLQGSVLTPERRRRVMETARRLGIRPFEAGVIVAIVQDRARRGQSVADAGEDLSLVPTAPGDDARRLPWMNIIAAVTTALVATWIVIRWLVR